MSRVGLMGRAVGGIESAMSSRPATPLTVFGGASSPKPEAPRCSERIPVIAGHSGIGIGSRRPNEDHAVLSITVSADQVLRVRKAVVALAHPAIDLLSVTPLPGGPRVRLTAHLRCDCG